MPMVRCKVDWDKRTEDRRAFDARDAKGRQIGGMFVYWPATVEPEPAEGDDSRAGVRHFNMPEGTPAGATFYVATCHAMRNGTGYGSSHGYQHHLSLTAVESARDTYFKGAEKRARKLART